jgi:hypothetical protein
MISIHSNFFFAEVYSMNLSENLEILQTAKSFELKKVIMERISFSEKPFSKIYGKL